MQKVGETQESPPTGGGVEETSGIDHEAPFQSNSAAAKPNGPPPGAYPRLRQKDGSVQLTACRFNCPPLPPGLATVDHDEPFQSSLSVWVAADPSAVLEPTARQNVVVGHDTELRWLLESPPCGLGTVDQPEPFHCSTNVFVEKVEVLRYDPTAMQKVLETHDTWRRVGRSGAAGSELAVQPEPFHTAIPLSTPRRWSRDPTAAQKFPPAHETSLSELCSGLVASDQVETTL
jgi:hypothetical protein